ncbi:MAG: phosphotransferase [Pseudomonadota bacterium]
MDTDEPWVLLSSGKLNTVFRSGDRVRRPMGPWSGAVHQLLRHLEASGLPLAPRVCGVAPEGEILTYLPGANIYRPWPACVRSAAWLAELGRWLRAFHEATVGFALQGEDRFVWGPPRASAGMVVNHGDLAPWNCLIDSERFAGVIDWDLARFGHRLDDLCQFSLEAVPLRASGPGTLGEAPSRAELRARLEAICSGYGALSPEEILAHMPAYLTQLAAEIRVLGAAGVAPFDAFLERGFDAEYARDLAHVRANWTGPGGA